MAMSGVDARILLASCSGSSAGRIPAMLPTKAPSIGNGANRVPAAFGSGMGRGNFSPRIVRRVGRKPHLSAYLSQAFVMMGSGVRVT
jgi:hypothetical protein